MGDPTRDEGVRAAPADGEASPSLLGTGRFRRTVGAEWRAVPFRIDGVTVLGREGDSLLTAILCLRADLGALPPDPRRRAGFCLIGLCQDCWVRLRGRGRVRACTTPLEPDMDVLLDSDGELW